MSKIVVNAPKTIGQMTNITAIHVTGFYGFAQKIYCFPMEMGYFWYLLKFIAFTVYLQNRLCYNLPRKVVIECQF